MKYQKESSWVQQIIGLQDRLLPIWNVVEAVSHVDQIEAFRKVDLTEWPGDDGEMSRDQARSHRIARKDSVVLLIGIECCIRDTRNLLAEQSNQDEIEVPCTAADAHHLCRLPASHER